MLLLVRAAVSAVRDEVQNKAYRLLAEIAGERHRVLNTEPAPVSLMAVPRGQMMDQVPP